MSDSEGSRREVRRYRTGEIVPETGLYLLTHNPHHLQHAALLLKEAQFPGCSLCQAEVVFELAYVTPGLFHPFQYRINELPEIDDKTSERIKNQ